MGKPNGINKRASSPFPLFGAFLELKGKQTIHFYITYNFVDISLRKAQFICSVNKCNIIIPTVETKYVKSEINCNTH